MSETIHVYPVDDLKPHNTDGPYCACAPSIEEYRGGWLVKHNSYDGREFFEEDEPKEGH